MLEPTKMPDPRQPETSPAPSPPRPPLALSTLQLGRLLLVDKLLDQRVQVIIPPREKQHVVGRDGGAAGVVGKVFEVDGDVF